MEPQTFNIPLFIAEIAPPVPVEGVSLVWPHKFALSVKLQLQIVMLYDDPQLEHPIAPPPALELQVLFVNVEFITFNLL